MCNVFVSNLNTSHDVDVCLLRGLQSHVHCALAGGSLRGGRHCVPVSGQHSAGDDCAADLDGDGQVLSYSERLDRL